MILDGSPSGNPPSGPCSLATLNGGTVSVQGWCLRNPGRMVIDNDAVTVVSQAIGDSPGTLVRIEKAKGAQTMLVGKAGDPTPDGTLADGGTELFFAGCDMGKHCGIFALPHGGGPVRMVAASDDSVANTFGTAFDLAVDANVVYWVTDGIWSAPRAGGVAKRLDAGAGAGAADRFSSIAVDASAVYATRPGDGSVVRQPLDGSAAGALVTGQRAPTRITAAGGTIYWLEWGTVGVDCTPGDGALDAWSNGAEKSLVSQLAGVSDLALVGGKAVYSSLGRFCNVHDSPIGSIRALTLSTGTSVEVAAAQLQPGNVASDGNDVYWTVVSTFDGSGAILHAPLP